MTEMVDRLHPQPLSLFGRGEKNVDRENLKIGIRGFWLRGGFGLIVFSLLCPSP
ncbi:hypothetical protein [Hydrococcus rivularis]|uniref:hypothetical protein n=1 Tax=Hydrococcus rivularis TaxID=1616834 RepID=UPI000A8E77A0|nr:hypothetical protein [Hydrococcus rivularis]